MTKINSICVYCGTGSHVDPAYQEAARKLGALLAEKDIRLVYGGGKVGLMGIISEACISGGGSVTGIIPEHIQNREVRNTDVSELFVVDSMHTRKRLMVEKSDAFVILPGGFGTLDESFEILTWKYLGLHDKPIVFINVNNFYDPLLRMVDHMVDSGFTPEGHRHLFQVVSLPKDVFAVLRGQEEHTRPDICHM